MKKIFKKFKGIFCFTICLCIAVATFQVGVFAEESGVIVNSKLYPRCTSQAGRLRDRASAGAKSGCLGIAQTGLREAFGCVISVFKCNISHRAVG